MPHLLMIDATLGAVALIVAACIVLRSGRSARPSKRHGEAAGLASEGTALGEMTAVPGFSEDAMDPDPGARGPDSGRHEPDPGVPEPDPEVYAPDPDVREPVGLEQAPPQVSGVADDDAGAGEPEPGPPEPVPGPPEPGAPEPARPEQAPSLSNGAAGARPGTHAPAAAEPGGPLDADGTVTSSGRVYSYYDGADQAISDYLAELGWSEESAARDSW